jgi:hypothetical protein
MAKELSDHLMEKSIWMHRNKSLIHLLAKFCYFIDRLALGQTGVSIKRASDEGH